MNDAQIWSRFEALYGDILAEDDLYRKKPLLAHYTSLETAERILKSGEIWLSNPLFMNDIEELRFGFFHGTSVFKSSDAIKVVLGTESRHAKFSAALDHWLAYSNASICWIPIYFACPSTIRPTMMDCFRCGAAMEAMERVQPFSSTRLR